MIFSNSFIGSIITEHCTVNEEKLQLEHAIEEETELLQELFGEEDVGGDLESRLNVIKKAKETIDVEEEKVHQMEEEKHAEAEALKEVTNCIFYFIVGPKP